MTVSTAGHSVGCDIPAILAFLALLCVDCDDQCAVEKLAEDIGCIEISRPQPHIASRCSVSIGNYDTYGATTHPSRVCHVQIDTYMRRSAQ